MTLHLTLAALLLAPPGQPAAATSPEETPIPAIELGPAPARPRPAPPPAVTPAPTKEGPAPAPAPAPAPPKKTDALGCDGSPNCKSMTIGGIIAGTLGLGGVVAGVVLFARPDEVLEDEPAYVKSYRPPALVATTLGAGTLISAVLVITAAHRGYKDQRRGDEPRKKPKANAKAKPRVRVTPTGLQGRF